ncbi:MAG: sigma-70 family RNA polymerase sigma factor [Chloroflexi bacterium]|nr:sigma-70 family RNA polymerase sigma factor [Chloroflexota bacterium]
MSASPTPPEAVLLQRIRGGDERALSELYDQYGGLVYSVAYHVLQNSTQAEEATQDTFLKVWKQAHAWDASRGRVTTWLLTITRYTAIDRLRIEQRREPRAQLDVEDIMNVVGENAPMDEAGWADERLIRELLQDLPPDQRKVLELAYFLDMSHTEMAEHLNVPLGTVKGRVRAGLIKLRDLWSKKTR